MRYILSLFLVSFFGLSGCSLSGDDDSSPNGSGGGSKATLPTSNGSHTETLVVMKDADWYGVAGEVLREYFEDPLYGLPQTEPTFKLLRVSPDKFTPLLKRTKSVLLFAKGDTSRYVLTSDEWAHPQVVAFFEYASEKDLIRMIRKHSESLMGALIESDRRAMEDILKRTEYARIPESLRDLGIQDMILPRSFRQTLDKDSIKIFRSQTLKTDQSLIFTIRPMDPDILPGQDVVAWRDTVGKHYYEGERKGSFMTTETLFPPLQINTKIDGYFAIESRGLWKMAGDFMGGPFISYTIYDEERQQILTIEGLIYGPEAKKRNLIFELSTIIQSVKLN
ncbi:MAG: DUF4837 family protein [Bacteroidota bacterium]|nr:DUF4837 family protein [Bacteroidota bacterium]MDX5446819.1 DUF4837 family protein [Bacteroidota bacterium]MDX5504812.1 DUF4837 family protein [Bacteroidota bacterium]